MYERSRTVHAVSRRQVAARAPAILALLLGLSLIPLASTAFGAQDVLDDILDTIDPTAPPPPPPPGSPPAPTEVPTQLIRIAPSDYADGTSELAGPNRASAREISNIVLSQSGSIPAENFASDMIWQWGQFIDHDIDLTENDLENPEQENIMVPPGDPYFDPLGEGGKYIEFFRSVHDPLTGTDPSNPRQQINTITVTIDASNVYGSDPVRQATLRANDGTGRLLTSPGDFLPYNTFGLPNAGGDLRQDLFLAGDVRANEQVFLTAMHTLWMREHNNICDRINKRYPELSGDQVYANARAIVAAEMQVITYQEFLPALLGEGSLALYTGYDPYVSPLIANGFSTAAYRLGHSMLSPQILRLDRHGDPIPEGPLQLKDAFFAPTRLTQEGGVAPIMRGLASQVMQRLDAKVVDGVRNFLFGDPGDGGLDLAALNIQRGRDHGLPDYNAFRIAYGLPPATTFGEISSDLEVVTALAQAYGNVNDVDAWVGMLAEDHVPGALVGPLLHASVAEQFERLRDGDPNWYQNRFSDRSQRALERNTLFDVITRNSDVGNGDIRKNVFVAN